VLWRGTNGSDKDNNDQHNGTRPSMMGRSMWRATKQVAGTNHSGTPNTPQPPCGYGQKLASNTQVTTMDTWQQTTATHTKQRRWMTQYEQHGAVWGTKHAGVRENRRQAARGSIAMVRPQGGCKCTYKRSFIDSSDPM